MLRDATQQGPFTAEAAIYERQDAWTAFPAGRSARRGGATSGAHSAAPLDDGVRSGVSVGSQPWVTWASCSSMRALPAKRSPFFRKPLASGRRWWKIKQGASRGRALLATGDHARADATSWATSAASMGDLANALRSTGQHDEALAVAENHAFASKPHAETNGMLAAGHGQCASILMAAGRHDEADARYELALAGARQARRQGPRGNRPPASGRPRR
jgi:hypothetical protein